MSFCRFVSYLSASLALVCLNGCKPSISNVEQGNADQEIYIGIGTEPQGLDPHLVTGETERYVLLSLMEGLTGVHPETLEVEPAVAKSWDISSDGMQYTFHLDPNARWSNGDPLTSADFLFAYERILTPALGAPYAYMLYPIRGAEAFNTGKTSKFETVGVSAPDPHTLIITLESPTPYLLSLPTHYTWYPLHKATILAHGEMSSRISKWTKPGNFVGNGYYTLEDWKLNNSIYVKKNPYHPYADEAKLEGIHFLPISIDAEERAFRANQLHLTNTVPIPRIDWYRENAPERIRFDTYLGVYYYAFNLNRGPLKDPRVRKALAYSIDRDAITEFVLKAGQKPAYHFTPPNTAGYTAKAGVEYNPELARQLLAEAGYPNGDGFPKFELLFNTSESHRTIAVAIQQMWKKELGIDIGLYNQEWKVYLKSRQNGEFDIMRAAWIGDYEDPSTFLNLGTTGNGNNHTGWSSEEYDRLIRQASSEQDQKKRYQLFQEAEAILLDEMPFIPIYFYVRSLLIHESVKGWYPNIRDWHPYEDVWLEE